MTGQKAASVFRYVRPTREKCCVIKRPTKGRLSHMVANKIMFPLILFSATVPDREGAGLLRASNMGDSQFMIIRESSVVFKSPYQQHRFGLPFQLGFGDGIRSDEPDQALEFMLPVMAGDTVVLASDGTLFY